MPLKVNIDDKSNILFTYKALKLMFIQQYN